jgi:hypothetical protein
MSQERYLLANQPSELERLRWQSLVWEPTGRQLLSKLGGSGGRALDVGCARARLLLGAAQHRHARGPHQLPPGS